MRQLALAAPALCLALLAGCGPDSKPVTSAAGVAGQAAASQAAGSQTAASQTASSQTAASQTAGAPCGEPAGMGYPSPVNAANEVAPKLSPKALRAQKSGCAGMKFHIAADGSPRDATLVVEAPTGFGFGDSALAALAQTRYGPGQPKSDWYYLNTVIVQSASTGTAARPSVY